MDAKTRRIVIGMALCVAFALAFQPAQAQSPGKLSITVSGVRNDNGSVRCGLWDSPNRFLDPGRATRGASAHVKDGHATCVFNDLPAGTYAVAVFHAENNETKLETGMFGKPKQGYGFSRNPSSTFGPPGFESAAFEYKGGNLNMPVRLSY